MKLLAHPFARIYAACAVAGLALAVVMFAELTMGAPCEVLLVAPESAIAGATVPVRVDVLAREFAFRDVPRLDVPVRLLLRDSRGVLVSSSALVSVASSSYGALVVPREASGEFTLHAEVIGESDYAGEFAEKPLFVGREPPPLLTRPRSLVSLPPTVRIGGGACVPEAPCELLVADDAQRASLLPTGSLASCDEPARFEGGFARFCGVVHGPDARACFAEEGQGPSEVDCETAATPIPVALGQVAMTPRRSVVPVGTEAEFDMFNSDSSGVVFVDVFEDERWVRAAHARVENAAELRGSFRLRFDRAGRFCVQAYSPGSWGTTVPTRCVSVVDRAPAEESLAIRYDLAAAELDALVLPAAVNGVDAAIRRTERQKGHVRYVALGIVASLAAFIALETRRRTRDAALLARSVMAEAGEDAARTLKRVARDRLEVAGVTLLVFLVVLSVVAFVLVRRLF